VGEEFILANNTSALNFQFMRKWLTTKMYIYLPNMAARFSQI